MSENIYVVYFVLFSALAIGVVARTLRKHTSALCVVIPFIIILIWFGYTKTGGFSAWLDYKSRVKLQQQAQALSSEGTDKILMRMQEHLKQHPNSSTGWYLLGRLYASQHQWDLAGGAFHRALQLDPANVQAEINEIQTLKAINHQNLNGDLRKRLQFILARYPNQADVLAMLAMDAHVNHDYRLEIKYLESLLPYVPVESIEAGMIRKALAAAYAQDGRESNPVN